MKQRSKDLIRTVAAMCLGVAALACAAPARAQAAAPFANTNSVASGLSVDHTLKLTEGGVLRNVGFPRFRIQPVATNNTVRTTPLASASIHGGTNAVIRRAKERALAKAAALGSTDAPARSASTPAPAPVAPEATRVATAAATPPGPSRAATPSPAAAPVFATPQLSVELQPLMDQARELYNRQQLEEAAAKYREVLKRDPENISSLSNLAVIRFQQGRLEEAEHLLNRALQAAPDDAYSHATVGIIYFKQDRIDDAVEELTRSLKLNPDNAEARNYLGLASWRKGWSSSAEQELRRAIGIQPDYADAHYNLVLIYTSPKLPFLGLAKFHYRKTLELGRPRDPDLEEILAGGKPEEQSQAVAQPALSVP